MIRAVQEHPVISAILLLSALAGAFLTFETIAKRFIGEPSGETPTLEGDACDLPPPDCGEDNQKVLGFLAEHSGDIVSVKLRLIQGAPTGWRNRCDPDYKTWAPIRNQMKQGFSLIELPTSVSDCRAAAAIQVANTELLPVKTDGASHYLISGEILIAEGQYGPVGWHILISHN